MGGSSKKVTVGYRYYLGMHMILCHGPVDKLIRILVDKRSAWSGASTGGQININAENLFGGESREGGISGAVDVEMGGSSQGQNSYLLSKIGSGIPSFRGVMGVVLRQVYMGINPYLKAWAFRVQRIHKRQNGITQWYDEKAEIALGRGFPSGDVWKYKVVPYADTTDYSSPNLDDSSFIIGSAPFANAYNAAADAAGFNGTPGTVIALENRVWLRTSLYLETIPDSFLFESFVDNGIKVYINGVQVVAYETAVGVPYTTGIPGSYFVQGTNTIAVQGYDDFNGGVPGDAFYFDVRLTNQSVTNGDMNPAHIIRECLTDPDWGMGYQESDVDDASFQAAADVLYAEGFGLSLLWDRQTAIEDFVKEVVRHIQASLYVDRTTGKFKLKLIRADYVEGDLLVLDESCVEKVDNFARPSFGDMVNSVTVNYWDSATATTASVTAQDTALIQMQGAVVGTTIQYPGCTKQALAAKLATRDLRTLSTPLLSCTVYANRKAVSLNVGDPFVLDWPDYLAEPTVMRVIGLALGDGRSNKVKITCTEDAFSFPDVAVVRPEVPDWEDPSGIPSAALHRVVEEAPYYELVQRLGQTTTDEQLAANPDIGYLLGSAAAPSAAINARLAVDAGAGYDGNDTPMDFCPVAFLAADLAPGATSVAITGGQALSSVVAGTHAQVGDELVKVVSVTDALLTVGRGVLDTVPAAHSSGAAVLFWDAYADSDGVEYVSGEAVDVKMLPVSGAGQLPLADAPEDTLAFTARASRPYPPGNLKVNGSAYPTHIGASAELALTWSHRDRVQQTAGDIVDTTAGNIGPEVGTTYNLRIYKEDLTTLLRTVSGSAATSYTYAAADELSDAMLPGAGFQSYDQAVMASAPTAYWRMGESSGTTMVDSTGHGYAGAYYNSPTLGSAGAVPGNTAVLFNGTSHCAEVPHNAALNPRSGEYAIETWMKWTGTAYGLVFGKFLDPDPYQGPTVFANYNTSEATEAGRLYFRDSRANGYRVQSSVNNLNDGVYRHFVFQRRQTSPGVWKLEIYINGALDASLTLSSLLDLNPTNQIFIMGRPALQLLPGAPDELAYYVGKSLTPTEVLNHYNARNGIASSYRLNGRLRFELESVRDGKTSHQAHDYTVRRPGYGFNYGEQYGE